MPILKTGTVSKKFPVLMLMLQLFLLTLIRLWKNCV